MLCAKSKIVEADSIIVIALAVLSQHRTGWVVLSPKLTVRVRAMAVSNRWTLRQAVSQSDSHGRRAWDPRYRAKTHMVAVNTVLHLAVLTTSARVQSSQERDGHYLLG